MDATLQYASCCIHCATICPPLLVHQLACCDESALFDLSFTGEAEFESVCIPGLASLELLVSVVEAAPVTVTRNPERPPGWATAEHLFSEHHSAQGNRDLGATCSIGH